MKRFVLPTLLLSFLLVLPAVSQSAAQERDLAEEIDDLKMQIDELVEQAMVQRAEIGKLRGRLDAQASEAAKLVKATEAAQRRGFLLPTPANDARGALLFGVRRYATVVTGTSPRGSLEDDIKKAQGGPILPVDEIVPDPDR